MKGRGEKDAADAKAYRLLQAEKLLELFKGSHKGRPVQTMQELVEWLASPEGVAATADDRDPNGKVIP
jgi:hypothetical protein